MPDAAALIDPAAVAAASGGRVMPDDPRLPILIKGATDALRLWCGWHVTPVVTETLILDGEGSPSLALPSRRVLDVSVVKIEGEPVGSDEFDWSKEGMLRLRRKSFPDRFRSVEVTLTHGFPDVPAMVSVLTQIVLGACASPLGATQEQAGSILVRWARTGMQLDESDRHALAPYRLQNWA